MRYPVNYIGITKGFSNSHHGIDLGWNSKVGKNQPIYAVEDGEVIYSKYQISGGYVLHIRHNGVVSEYGHLLKGSIKVKVGDKVKKGQEIAKMGASGMVTGTHLHFGIYKGSKINYSKNEWLNPITYLCSFKNQTIGDNTKKNYNVHQSKIVTDVKQEPLNVRDSENKITKELYNGNEVEYYGKNSKGKAIVDNLRNWTTLNKYLK